MMVLSLLLGIVFGVLGPAIGFVIVATKAQGRPRSLGLLGFGIAGVIGILTQVANRLLPTIIYRLQLSMTILTTVWGIVFALVGLIPLIVLAIAISANRSVATGSAAGYPAAGYGEYQSLQPDGRPSAGGPTGG